MGRKRSNIKGNTGGNAGGKGAETKAGGGGGHFDASTISFDECGSLLETRIVNASMKYGNEYVEEDLSVHPL